MSQIGHNIDSFSYQTSTIFAIRSISGGPMPDGLSYDLVDSIG